MKKERNLHYKVFAQRIEDEIQDWLKMEKKKYKSWNLFFKELKKRYGSEKLQSNQTNKNHK